MTLIQMTLDGRTLNADGTESVAVEMDDHADPRARLIIDGERHAVMSATFAEGAIHLDCEPYFNVYYVATSNVDGRRRWFHEVSECLEWLRSESDELESRIDWHSPRIRDNDFASVGTVYGSMRGAIGGINRIFASKLDPARVMA